MADSTLSAPQRAESIIRLLSSLFDREWTDIDIILTSFQLQGLNLEDYPDYATVYAQCRASLQAADSLTLSRLATYVLGSGITTQVLDTKPSDTADDLWGSVGVVRVFLSHLASQREFVGRVSSDLHNIRISSFVAHNSIDVSRAWQDEIERALRTADVLAGIAHPGFYDSFWTQQEIGWALGREIPVVIIGSDESPRGFPARYQAPMLRELTPWRAASAIALWLTRQDRWASAVVDGLVHDLQHATSFGDAREAAERLNEVGKLTETVLDAIEHAYLSNDQLYPNHVGAAVVSGILKSHGRELPKDKPFRGTPRLRSRGQLFEH